MASHLLQLTTDSICKSFHKRALCTVSAVPPARNSQRGRLAFLGQWCLRSPARACGQTRQCLALAQPQRQGNPL